MFEKLLIICLKSTEVTFTWEAADCDPTSYYIYRSEDNEEFMKILKVNYQIVLLS